VDNLEGLVKLSTPQLRALTWFADKSKEWPEARRDTCHTLIKLGLIELPRALQGTGSWPGYQQMAITAAGRAALREAQRLVDAIYYPTYVLREDLDDESAAWLRQQQGVGPLEVIDVTDVCATMAVSAELRDKAGKLLGRVNERGEWWSCSRSGAHQFGCF